MAAFWMLLFLYTREEPQQTWFAPRLPSDSASTWIWGTCNSLGHVTGEN